MKILSLGSDDQVLEPGSKTAKRIIEYGGLVKKYDVVVFSKKRHGQVLSEKVKAYSVSGFKYFLPLSRIISLVKIYFFSKKLIGKNRYDLITVQDPFELSLVGWILAKKFDLKLNIQEHGDFFSEKYWRNENIINYSRYWLGKYLIKKADSVRVVSDKIRRTLISIGIQEERIVEVPVFTDSEKVITRSDKGVNDKSFVFLWLGRFVKQKNLTLLIKAFSGVVKTNPDSVLRIIGKGPERAKLVRCIADYNLERNAYIKDWVDDIYKEYTLADAYVLPSNYEGWGRVIIEAAHSDLPIIMTTVGCAEEVIKDNKSGLVVPIGDQKALEEAMRKMINDNQLRNNLTINAKREVINLPNKEETLRLYKKSWEIALGN